MKKEQKKQRLGELKKEQYFLKSTLFHVELAGLQQCDFLVEWLKKKYREFSEVPEKPRKTNIPKGAPLPIPRKKLFYALYKGVTPQLSLKKFAQFHNVPYGTVRNWNINSTLQEEVLFLRLDFLTSYVGALEDLYFSPERDISKHPYKTVDRATRKALQHMKEAEYYDDSIAKMILLLLVEKFNDLSGDDEDLDWRLVIFNFIRISDKRDIFNPPKNEKQKKSLEEYLKTEGRVTEKFTEMVFSQLKEVIKAGDTEVALRLADELADMATFNVKYKTDLKLSVLNRGKKVVGGLLEDET